MTKHTKTIIINISLLLLVVMSGGVAAYLRGGLPSHFNGKDTGLADLETESGKDLIGSEVALEVMPVDSSDSEQHNAVEKNEIQEAPVRDSDAATSLTFGDADISGMQTSRHPFAGEAKKILSGKLAEEDSLRRRKILNYCEHFRSAYTSKDIDFIRQVLSDDALIIVGHTVKPANGEASLSSSPTVRFNLRSKHEYLRNLSKVFASNKKIDVDFSDFKIMRHPTMDGIYGVTLRQKYKSDTYSDDGFIFLLWDFRNPSMPMIHVRTWQPADNLSGEDEIIGIGDFNLE